MEKCILIVGAGFGQLPAIETAKSLGVQTIVVDKNPNAVGAKIADVFYEIDILDKVAVLSVAKKHKISGIMTMQSDLPVPTIGYVNDALNLTGVTLEVASHCSNKMEMRKRLAGKSAAQPHFEIITTLKEAEETADKIGYPCVFKAPDSSGSRGITKVNSKEEIKVAYNEAFKYSRQESILIEEFIEGLEFGAQTFSLDGNCISVLLHGDTMSPPPYMIPIGHSFPFELLNEHEKSLAIKDIKDAVTALGITNGPSNVDLILDKNTKRVKIIEIGARIGATCLPELVFYHTGIDWVKNTILNAIGEEIDLDIKHNKSVAALIIESPMDGTYDSYEFLDSESEKSILEFEISVKKGDLVSLLRKGTDRIGKIILYGIDAAAAESRVLEVRNSIIIKVS